jgi:acyl carrier protein
MDRAALRAKLLDLLEQETWQRPESLADDVTIREGLKLDSVDLLAVSLRVEREFGISFASSDFAQIEKAGDLLDTILAKVNATRARAA